MAALFVAGRNVYSSTSPFRNGALRITGSLSAGQALDRKARLGKQIQIYKDLKRWYSRAELMAYMNLAQRGLTPEAIDLEIEQLRKEIADINKAERRRRR